MYLNVKRAIENILVHDETWRFAAVETPSMVPMNDDTVLAFGNGTNSWDFKVFGNTSSDYVYWDASAGTMYFAGAATIITGGGTSVATVSNGDGSTALAPQTQGIGTTKAKSSILLGTFSATATTAACPSLDFLKSANATVGSNTVVASGEVLGEINWFGADGTDFKSAAGRIACIVDATPGAGDMPGRLVFSTSIDGGEVLTEAMRINSAQTVTCFGGLIAKSTQAAAITTTRVLTAADSGGIFSVAKTSAYAITLPTPAQGIRFKFLILDTGANAVTFSDGSAHLFGNICEAGTVPIAMTGTTLSAAASGSVGDWLEFQAIDATHYLVTGSSIAASKFTIA